MFNFADKSWWTSKTFWTSVILFVTAGLTANGYVIPEWVYQALIAFGLYSVRDAIAKNK